MKIRAKGLKGPEFDVEIEPDMTVSARLLRNALKGRKKGRR